MDSAVNYRKINDTTGWVIFGIAFLTYLLTVSPTASFWDCGEFIAVANELQVPHPPGAPMYLMLARLFAFFAPDKESVAYCVNLLSVFSSAFTSLFTFWSITLLAKKVLIKKDSDLNSDNTLRIMFAGAVGALTCTFCDSIWFNAVEAEVYAMSSFFTAVVFWAMLKWDAQADEPHADRWLLLIAYIMGLSSGTHLLNLLTIPALAFIYYFRRYPFTWQGAILTFVISVVILAVIQYGIMQATFDIGKTFELWLVGTIDLRTNTTTGLGLPYGSGLVLWLLIVFAGLAFGAYYSQKNKLRTLNLFFLSTILVYIGFSSYAMIFIRSNANPPIDENNPGNILSFLSYMKREQYGDRPLFRGPLYHQEPVAQEQGDPIYLKYSDRDRYVLDGYKQELKYSNQRFFPRMHSQQHYNSQPYGYSRYVKNKGADINNPADDQPTGIENFKFFFHYQVYHMYIRYFLWNFVGRASDEQDDSWESGIEFWRFMKMPAKVYNDPTRNHYYYLPLILGILGIIWHFSRARQDATVVALLFFFTGLAIIIYLNQTPSQPRERDYSYAGSFQTFCIWVGLGVIGLAEILEPLFRSSATITGGLLSLVLVPGIMGAKNWRDHSRAGNYVAPDSAYNLLNSCAENAILFTNGDNDTFPLWYLQEVEDVRTDVRIVNLSLLNTDWYIDQLKNQYSNKSAPLPISYKEADYIGEKNAYKAFTKKVIELPVDKEQLKKNKAVFPEDLDKVESPMKWEVVPRGSGQQSYLLKQDLMILDMVVNNAKNGWERPIYFAITIPNSSYIGLQNFFQLEGMAYRLVPIRTQNSGGQAYMGRVAKELMYDNLMKKFRYRNLDNPEVFYDRNIIRMVGNFRNNFFRLASAYLQEAEEVKRDTVLTPDVKESKIAALKSKAREVIDYSLKTITEEAVPAEPYIQMMHAEILTESGDTARAAKMVEKAFTEAVEILDYEYKPEQEQSNTDLNLYTLRLVERFYEELKDYANADKASQALARFTGEPPRKHAPQPMINPPAPKPATDTNKKKAADGGNTPPISFELENLKEGESRTIQLDAQGKPKK